MRLASLGLTLTVLLALVTPAKLHAQAAIDVQQKAAEGDYMAALKSYDQMPKRKLTTAAVIAAGKSAWALSLPERAKEHFETALQDETLSDTQRARLYLSRGIIEFQEDKPKVALLFAQKAAGLIKTAGPLRSRAWLLWAQVLSTSKEFGAAEDKFKLAMAEADQQDLAEIHFLLGECELKLGKLDAARENFESVPLNHDRTALTIRYLAQIAVDSGKFSSAEFWLSKGRAEYPDEFLDSWVDYALVQVAISQNDRSKVEELRLQAQQKYPPSDFWLNLLNASAEAFFWKVVRS